MINFRLGFRLQIKAWHAKFGGDSTGDICEIHELFQKKRASRDSPRVRFRECVFRYHEGDRDDLLEFRALLSRSRKYFT
jgi:hypothetical protein